MFYTCESAMSNIIESCHTCEWVMPLMRISHFTYWRCTGDVPHMQIKYVTHVNESCYTWEWAMSRTFECHMSHGMCASDITQKKLDSKNEKEIVVFLFFTKKQRQTNCIFKLVLIGPTFIRKRRFPTRDLLFNDHTTEFWTFLGCLWGLIVDVAHNKAVPPWIWTKLFRQVYTSDEKFGG